MDIGKGDREDPYKGLRFLCYLLTFDFNDF